MKKISLGVTYMYFILFLFLVLMILLVLAYSEPLNIKFIFNSTDADMHLAMVWLRDIKINAVIKELRPYVSVFVFDREVMSRFLKKRKGQGGTITALALHDTDVRISYGLNSFAATGLISAALGVLGSVGKIDHFEQIPEFLPADEYLKIDAATKLNIGKTVSNMILLKSKLRKRRKNMDQSNSVQSNLTENVDSLFRSLENFTQREGIIGKAVIQGDKTFLPVVSITVGYGGGNASMKGQAGVGMGANANTGTGALGLGAKLCTDGIIVVDKQDVSLLPMNSAAAVSLVDKIPQIISGMTQQKQANQQTQGQNQGQNFGGMQS